MLANKKVTFSTLVRFVSFTHYNSFLSPRGGLDSCLPFSSSISAIALSMWLMKADPAPLESSQYAAVQAADAAQHRDHRQIISSEQRDEERAVYAR
jgi:hypothetical protein